MRAAWRRQLAAGLLLLCGAAAHGQDAPAAAPTPQGKDEASVLPASVELHGQATYVFQRKSAFDAAYSGPNSLSTARERSYSVTSTLFAGWRATPDLEFFFDAEGVQGLPMSGLLGLGGLTNSELQKTAGRNPLFYRARAYLRKTWNLDEAQESVESDIHQLSGLQSKRRVVLSAGNLAVSDIFDANAYAHDGRTQFLNWGFLTHGAYDFAADARGYSWGGALEFIDENWALRVGRFMEPRQSNGLKLDWSIQRHHGDQIELERDWTLDGQPGRVRLLGFRNTAVMGAFDDALRQAALSPADAGPPSVAGVRREQSKKGLGLNLEQAFVDGSGVFARWGHGDGLTETYSFAEIDRSVSVGGVLSGSHWGRASDLVGLALGRNGLSGPHQAYLAAGGLGFFLGDGALVRYKPEAVAELYYQVGVLKGPRVKMTLAVGGQRIRNPGYNADRGPVNVASFRLHGEF